MAYCHPQAVIPGSRYARPGMTVVADVSDCASTGKYWRLPVRKATGAGFVLARARIKASTRGGRYDDLLVAAQPVARWRFY
jgi:hypothetical protein